MSFVFRSRPALVAISVVLIASASCAVWAGRPAGAALPRTESGVLTPSGNAAPASPRIGTATAGNGSATVTFTPGSDGGYAIVEYAAVCASSNGGQEGGATSFGFVGPIVVPGLTNGKRYVCVVAAANSQAVSRPSASSNRVTVGAPGPPTTPTVTRIGVGHLKVSFTDSTSNGARITRFTAACRSSNGGASNSRTGPASPLGVKRLTTGKAYTCTVTATNSRGTGPSSAQSPPVTA